MSRATASSKKRGLPKQVRMRHDNHYVEELSRRSEVSVGRLLAISSLEPDPDQPRTEIGELDDLVDSIRERGVLEPILVRPNPDSERSARYRIIAGERRYRASLEAGLVEVPVIELEVDAQEALEIALIENLQRKDLTPFEEADGYRALQEGHEYTHEQISESVGKSRVSITESLSLLNMPTRVRETANALGIASKSMLLEVMKADSPEEMIRLLERIKEHGLTRAALRRELAAKAPAKKQGSRRPKPYVFRFQPPSKSYNLALTFKQSTVDREDLMHALEEILGKLREEEDAENRPS